MALDPSLLSGAINGTSDPTQNIFRRRAAATPTPGAAPAPQGIASPAPSASDNGQGAIVAASGGNDAYDVQNANAVAKQARTGGGAFDPAAPLPGISSISPGILGAGNPTQQPLPQGAVSPVSNNAVATSATPASRAANLVGAAVPTTTGIATLPTMTINGSSSGGGSADPGATTAQSAFLASNGVPLNQQTATAIGGDGTGDNAAQDRRAAIKAGTTSGQNVRLGYDSTSRIYGTSSKPGGPIDTFTGAGIADANSPSTKINGANAVALSNAGFGLTSGDAARSAQVRADAATAPQAISSLGGQLDNARDTANSAQRDTNANLSRANDPFDPIGRQIASLRNTLSQQTTRSGREAVNGQINTLLSGLVGGGQQSAAGKIGVEDAGVKSITDLTNTGTQQAGETQRTAMTQGGETQRKLLDQNAPTAEVTPDGGYRVRTGTTTAPVTGIDGEPVDAPLGASLTEGGRALQGFANQIGTAVANGTMTPEAANEALTQARQSLITGSRVQGGGIAGPSANSAQPPKEAAAFLRQNPSMRAQFDAKYGRGAAYRILSNS